MLDKKPLEKVYNEVGDNGIVRGFVWGDQAGCWQHAACLTDINELIIKSMTDPGWVHRLLEILLEKKLDFVNSMRGAKFDLVETGGGSASSTLVSPDLHREFCLPYDRKLHDALHSAGFKITYHTCGGTYGIEEYIIANGADCSETLAPKSIGGNQEPWEVKEKVGNRICTDRRYRSVQCSYRRTRQIKSKRWFIPSLRKSVMMEDISVPARTISSKPLLNISK